MTPYLIIFKFAARDRLNRVCDQLRVLPVMIPLQNPLPVGSRIVLFLTAPQTQSPVVLNGSVVRQTETGSEIVLENQSPKADVSDHAQEPCEITDTSDKGPASFQWLSDVVLSQDQEPDQKPLPDFSGKTVTEKKVLSSMERDRIAPVGEWIMKLARAILRTGYYDPRHPGASTAKQGLYEDFLQVMADCPELLLNIEESGGRTDILITGILDEPVSVRTVVGKGSAALFVPKLFEYFEKKKLLSIAIKKEITPDHFEAFVRIMSDPKVDKTGSREAGGILTAELVKNNITEISTVFDNDQLNFEKNLPWRVEIAMQRLAKDLKLLPMFTGISKEALWKMKQQSIQDIIRPLCHPQLFNEFLVNCYIISENVTDMEPAEIEQILVESFPAGLLLPTSRHTFEELDWLNEKAAVDPDNQRILQRLEGIKRILKLIARRVVLENISGGHLLLAHLYDNNILSFEQLPADARYIINTRSMAKDVSRHPRAYADALAAARDRDESMVYIKCFRRVVPILIENRDWNALQAISRGIVKAGPDFSVPPAGPEDQPPAEDQALVMESPDAPEGSGPGMDIFDYVFSGHLEKLCHAYENSDNSGRDKLDLMFTGLGYSGIQIMGRILSEATDREVRARVVDRLASQSRDSRRWVLNVLQDQSRAWYIHRNALMILSRVATDFADADFARIFLKNDHPRLRLEALNVIAALKPPDAEGIVTELIRDPDSRVSWRALKAVTELPVASQSGIDGLFNLINADVPGNSKGASARLKLAARVINAVCSLPDLSGGINLDSRVLEIVEPIAFAGKKRFSLLKRSGPDSDEIQVLKAAISLLARVGSDLSADFLKNLAHAHSSLADQALQAIETIKQVNKEA